MSYQNVITGSNHMYNIVHTVKFSGKFQLSNLSNFFILVNVIVKVYCVILAVCFITYFKPLCTGMILDSYDIRIGLIVMKYIFKTEAKWRKRNGNNMIFDIVNQKIVDKIQSIWCAVDLSESKTQCKGANSQCLMEPSHYLKQYGLIEMPSKSKGNMCCVADNIMMD